MSGIADGFQASIGLLARFVQVCLGLGPAA